jgi:hypothetical protein
MLSASRRRKACSMSPRGEMRYGTLFSGSIREVASSEASSQGNITLLNLLSCQQCHELTPFPHGQQIREFIAKCLLTCQPSQK